MAIYELYSSRKRRENGELPDVYSYNHIPSAFRVQISYIWSETISRSNVSSFHYHNIVKVLRREYGKITLDAKNKRPHDSTYSEEELKAFFFSTTDNDKVIDIIEITLKFIDKVTGTASYVNDVNGRKKADAAIEEFNTRAKYHGVGYQYSDEKIIRVDSELVHGEIVVPALILLRDPLFKNAQLEFISAHEHYRHGRTHEVLVDCLKAFESTMKIICDKRRWVYDQNKGASELVRACLDNNLIPSYWQNHFSGLKSVLTSGIPTPRNKQGGHGAGSVQAQEPPTELLSYVIHMTASTILFLVESDKNIT